MAEGKDCEQTTKATTFGRSRRPYEPPKLAECGNVVELTQGVNGSMPDHGQGQKTRLG